MLNNKQMNALYIGLHMETIKPLFVLLFDVGSQSTSRVEARLKTAKEYLKNELGDIYSIVVFPSKETKVQVYYPNGTKDAEENTKEYKDIIKELAKLTSLKNIRIKFEEEI